MQFSGILSNQNPDHLNLMAHIKLDGLTAEQKEIQRYQDCYHARLFKPADRRKEARMLPWGTKWDGAGNPVPENKWKPRYIISLPKKIVGAHTAYLFSEESFPTIKATSPDPAIYDKLELDPRAKDAEAARRQAANAKLQQLLDALIRLSDLETVMQSGSKQGLIQGFVFLLISVWDSAPDIEVLDRKWTRLVMDPQHPKRIDRLIEQYTLQETDEYGRTIDYLYRREVDATTWREWKMQLPKEGPIPKLTDAHLQFPEFAHNLGFVPVVKLATPDGESIFADEIVDNIHGLIGQDNDVKASLKKNLDPQRYMLVEEDEDYEADESPEGEAKVPLETGSIWPLPAKGVGDFSTQGSHEIALKDRENTVHEILDACHVVEVPESNQQSGKALNIRLKPTKAYISSLRTSMGRKGVALVAKMLLDIAIRLLELKQSLKLPADVELPKRIPGNEFSIGLDWGQIIPPDEDDLEKIIFNTKTAKESGFIAKKTAVTRTAPYFGIEDVDAEMEAIAQDQADQAAQFMQSQNALFNQQKPVKGLTHEKPAP